MNSEIREFRQNLAKKMTDLMKQIVMKKRLFIREYEEKFHKKSGYVYLENLATYDEEIEAVRDIRQIIRHTTIRNIKSVSEFREGIIRKLEETGCRITRLRAGIRIITDYIISSNGQKLS